MIAEIFEIETGTVFHFKNSLIPFTYVYVNNELMYLNLNTFDVFSEDELSWHGFTFYPGNCVETDGKLDWVE